MGKELNSEQLRELFEVLCLCKYLAISLNATNELPRIDAAITIIYEDPFSRLGSAAGTEKGEKG